MNMSFQIQPVLLRIYLITCSIALPGCASTSTNRPMSQDDYKIVQQKIAEIDLATLTPSSESARLIANYLESDNEHLRARASYALTKMKSFAEPELPHIIKGLDDPDAGVKMNLLSVLWQMDKTKAQPALPKIRSLTQDPDTNVANNAKAALTVLESQAAGRSDTCGGANVANLEGLKSADRVIISTIAEHSKTMPVIYGHLGCRWTRFILEQFKTAKIGVEFRDVTKSKDAKQEYELAVISGTSGYSGYPTWLYDGKIVVGADKAEIEKAKEKFRK